MARNSRVTMFGLWRCVIWWGHNSWNALEDEVRPTQQRLQTWLWLTLAMTILIFENWTLHLAGFEMQSIRLWSSVDGQHCSRGRCRTHQGHWFRIWQEELSESWSWLSIVCTVFILWRSWNSSVSWITIAQKWNNCNLYFFCENMHYSIVKQWTTLNFMFAKLILNLFADVLVQSMSVICGLTAAYVFLGCKSTCNDDQPHCGNLEPHTLTQLSTS